MKRLTTYPILLSSYVMTALLSTACSSDLSGPDDSYDTGIATDVTFTISSPFNQPGAIVSRADGSPASPDNDNENIKDWFIVFADKEGTVRKILRRSDAETKVTSPSSPVERENFHCILHSGTYSIYAFANITPDELKASTAPATGTVTGTGLSFEVGKKIKADEVNRYIWTSSFNGFDIDHNKLPMTGYLPVVKVENTIEERFSIEVVRMAAKVKLLLSNPSEEEITIEQIALDPVTETPVSLFPTGDSGISYAHLGNSSYTPLPGATYYKYLHNLASPVTVPPKAEKTPLQFYINESVSDRANDKAFTLFLTVAHKKADGETTETIQHNITNDIRGYINRNDLIEIPVILSRYDIVAEAIFYPPIGGYPAYLSTTDPEGAQVFTFGTQGEFAIIAKVYDKITSTHLSPSLYSIDLVKDSGNDVKIEGDAGIFTRKPTRTPTSSALPDEITGELGTTEGKARLTLSVKVYAQPKENPGAKVTNEYSRPIYVKRDNNLR